MSESKITCPDCGAIYLMKSRKEIYRVQDSFECNDCGLELKKWSGAIDFSFEQIKKGKLKRETT